MNTEHYITKYYHKNGKIQHQETLKGGIRTWYDNGQKEYEITYKDGKFDGLYTWWYRNGNKKYEGTFKDGKEVGLHILWKQYGQILEVWGDGELKLIEDYIQD